MRTGQDNPYVDMGNGGNVTGHFILPPHWLYYSPMELMDFVDENDVVIGQAPRTDIYANRLRHRIAHVLVFNDQGKMALQLRGPEVSFSPNHWSTAAGGHVHAGEDFLAAARREMEEEIGITPELEFLYKELYYNQTQNSPKFLGFFQTIHNGPFKLHPIEVAEMKFFSLPEIQQMVSEGALFHPELLFVLEKHFGIEKIEHRSNRLNR